MISIIIPCKNRIGKLKLCIESIYKSIEYAKKEKKFDYEIIVVNDHSEIGFQKIINDYFPKVKIIDSDKIGPGYARNLGIKNSKGKYLFFIDSDCIASKQWIYKGIDDLDNNKELVVQGIPWLFQKKENIYFGTQEEKLYKLMFSTYLYDTNKTKMTDSRNLIMKKDIINILGNEVFSETMTRAAAESRVFGNRCLSNNIEILFDEKLCIYHEDSLDIESVCKQKYRHGSGRIEIWKEIPTFDYLFERYYSNPINNGIDKDYILPSHTAFLLGYFQNLKNDEKYNDFLNFITEVFEKYKKNINEYGIINTMISQYEA